VEAENNVPACPIVDAHGHKRTLCTGLLESTFLDGIFCIINKAEQRALQKKEKIGLYLHFVVFWI